MAFARIRDKGIRRVGFGDIFLEDLRSYRERQLAALGLTCVFPLWEKQTRDLARRFIDEGFRALTVCVDSRVLVESFAGRHFDLEFLEDLPGDVDPCGENGEFHTFVFDGPIFSEPIEVTGGAVVERDGFFFYDLQSAPICDRTRRSPRTFAATIAAHGSLAQLAEHLAFNQLVAGSIPARPIRE